ncbi:MAG: YajQ family cyclic di-GMP-binding protein [Bdellovibrionaceae bacterium]|nr:YajQ family cyclic di-GMP-binding protein [Pseudobdellovibrionaceae bacterium]
MPSFDIASEVSPSEITNALLMARKEISGRFDFKNVTWDIVEEKDSLVLSASDEFKLRALWDIVFAKLAKRDLSLKNFQPQPAEISSVGRARQIVKIQQGFSSEVAKEVAKAIKSSGLKVQAQIQEQKVRVTGKSRDDLQTAIQHIRSLDLPVGISFGKFPRLSPLGPHGVRRWPVLGGSRVRSAARHSRSAREQHVSQIPQPAQRQHQRQDHRQRHGHAFLLPFLIWEKFFEMGRVTAPMPAAEIVHLTPPLGAASGAALTVSDW